MKTNLDSMFKTDEKMENDGVDFVVREASDAEGIKELSFRVRHFSATNPRVKAAMASHYKPYARQVELGTLDQKKADEITVKLFIDVCLVGWKGVEIDGEEKQCTKDNALLLFTRLPKLFDTLWKYANDFNNYREDVGNS